MKSTKIYEENTYTGFSISKLIYWKYSRIRTYLHKEKNSDRKETLMRLKKTRELKDTKSGPALIILRGKNSALLDKDVIEYFFKKQSIFSVNDIPTFTNCPEIKPNYIVLNDEPFWHSKESRFVKLREDLLHKMGEEFKVIQPAQRFNLVNSEHTIHYHGNPLTTIIRNSDIDRTMGIPNITSFHAIASAIYLGYSPIILSGLELTFPKYLAADETGFWLDQSHYSNYPQERIKLDTFRRSVSDLFGSLAFQIQSLKIFDEPIYIFGYESFVDTLPRIGKRDFQRLFLTGEEK